MQTEALSTITPLVLNSTTLTDWVVIIAFVVGGFGVYRGRQEKSRKDWIDELVQRDEVRKAELLEQQAKNAKLESDFAALSRVVTNEAVMTAIAERMSHKFEGMASSIQKALDEHNRLARDHWEGEKRQLDALIAAILTGERNDHG